MSSNPVDNVWLRGAADTWEERETGDGVHSSAAQVFRRAALKIDQLVASARESYQNGYSDGERAASVRCLPETATLRELITDFSNASFDCGEWDGTSEGSYREVHARYAATRDALVRYITGAPKQQQEGNGNGAGGVGTEESLAESKVPSAPGRIRTSDPANNKGLALKADTAPDSELGAHAPLAPTPSGAES